MTKIRKIKKRCLIPVIFIVMIFTAAVIYFQFTSLGYRMTVPYRDFTEIQKNVYVENNYSGDIDEVKSLIDETRNRVFEFLGSIESPPTVIISDNTNMV